MERREQQGSTTYLFNRLTIETHRSNYTVDGSISTSYRSDSADLNCDLKIVYDDEYIAINSTLSRPDATRLEGHLSIYPSQNPLMAFKIQGRVESVANQDYRVSIVKYSSKYRVSRESFAEENIYFVS